MIRVSWIIVKTSVTRNSFDYFHRPCQEYGDSAIDLLQFVCRIFYSRFYEKVLGHVINSFLLVGYIFFFF